MEITVLCKVVDNFGDIGVCWRLCMQLKKKYPEINLNLVVQGLDSFKKIWNEVQEKLAFQKICGINVYDWNNFDFCYKEFSENQNRLQVILECFQCGRPDWLEKILFDDDLTHTVQIIMIDYLTAEKYAEDFHKLKSLTRRAKVQKVNFMPGFTEKTGGLIIDQNWQTLKPRNKNGGVLFFTYDKPQKFWISFLKGVEKSGFDKKIMIAQGNGADSLKKSLEEFNKKNHQKFDFENLSFLNQNDWDILMQNCSSLVIRGEESMSRACLSGLPFIWHAYPQTDEYQIVKMNALLERMKRHFSDSDFEIISKMWTIFNSPAENLTENEIEDTAFLWFTNIERLVPGFFDFSKSLINNGDLVSNLMTFINQIYIM